MVDIDSIKPREKNPRVGNIELIKESLETNGQYRPIVVEVNSKEILAGNHTWKAAKELGWQQIAATFITADEETAAKIVLIDNRANDVAGYDNEELIALIKELDNLTGTGYNELDITQILQEIGEAAAVEGKTDPDNLPDEDEDEEPVVKLGEVWQLGEHRLICGDSTDPKVLEKLLDGEEADIIITDPPYGVGYSSKNEDTLEYRPGSSYKDIANDELEKNALRSFLKDAFTTNFKHLKPGGPIYIFSADYNRLPFQLAMEDAGVELRQALIWVKNHMVLGRQDYQWQHEPILYGWRDGAAHKWYGNFDKKTVIDLLGDIDKMTKDELKASLIDIRDQIQGTVIYHDKPHRSALHPTIKPVGLIELLISNSSKYKDIILDCFAGSGSTLLAAHRQGRRAYVVELDPGYCDLIIKRWEEYTEQKAQKIVK